MAGLCAPSPSLHLSEPALWIEVVLPSPGIRVPPSPQEGPKEPSKHSKWVTHPGPGGWRDVVVALRVPKPYSVTTGTGQPTQGTCARGKQRGSWGPAGACPPSSCGEDAAARRRHRGRRSKQTCAWDLTPSFLAQLPREPRARPKRGGGSPGSPWGGLLTTLDPKHPLQPQPPLLHPQTKRCSVNTQLRTLALIRFPRPEGPSLLGKLLFTLPTRFKRPPP